MSINSALDEFTFASFMDYLVRQVAVMNAYAALCPNTGADRERWVEATLSQVCFVRERSQAARDRALSSFTWPVAATED